MSGVSARAAAAPLLSSRGRGGESVHTRPCPSCDHIVHTPLSTHRGSRPRLRAITSGSSFLVFLPSPPSIASRPVAHTSRTPPHPACALTPRTHYNLDGDLACAAPHESAAHAPPTAYATLRLVLIFLYSARSPLICLYRMSHLHDHAISAPLRALRTSIPLLIRDQSSQRKQLHASPTLPSSFRASIYSVCGIWSSYETSTYESPSPRRVFHTTPRLRASS